MHSFKAARTRAFPVITGQSGAVRNSLFDIQTNESRRSGSWRLSARQLGYRGQLPHARFDLNVASRIRGKLLDDVLAENQPSRRSASFP